MSSWINGKGGIWVRSVKLSQGKFSTRSSGIRSSDPNIKWNNEIKSIKTKAEQSIDKRLAKEGLKSSDKENWTFLEVSEKYKNSHNYDKYRMRTIEEEFGSMNISKITSIDIWNFHNSIIKKTSPETWNRYRNILNAIFNMAIAADCIIKNPVKSVKKYTEQKIMKYLTQKHVDRLLEEAQKESYYLYSLVYTALNTGKRKSEILNLKWSDIDFVNGTLTVLVGKKIGGSQEQVMNPPSSLFKVLTELRKYNLEKPFPKFPRRAWSRIVDKVDKEIGMPDKRFHALRHRCATKIIDEGGTLYDTQHYLFHSSSSTTERYAHISKERDEKIRSLLEK